VRLSISSHEATMRFKLIVLIATLILALSSHSNAQQRAGRGARGQAAGTAHAAAPIDITGYWVSIVTEDWQYRMITPAKGQYNGLPISGEGRRLADTWDPAKDEASGNQCKAYGAGAIMRMPGHLHIVWDGENTLRMDVDTGTQTRLFRFSAPESQDAQRTWQGQSAAQWQTQGNLKVVTTRMRPGYLRKNGVPYSEDAVLTEYYERITAPNKDEWLILTSILEDPLYLNSPFVTSMQFKKLSDGSAWHPTPCSAK
jgi:hypothetical protein